MFLIYNSAVRPEIDFRLSANDRAFQYGDGLFETVRYENGQIWFWSDHYDRLTTGMAALQLTIPDLPDSTTLHQTVLSMIEANALTSQSVRIKIQVWRRPGGLYTPTTTDADLLITARNGQSFAITEKSAFSLYDAIRLSPSPVSQFKTLNALPYVLAGLYRQQHQLDEVILLDTRGNLGECVASNLFWYRSATLYTPSLRTGCINGIARRQLLNAFPDAQEGFFKPDDLQLADVVFTANVMGIQVLRGQMDVSLREKLLRIFSC